MANVLRSSILNVLKKKSFFLRLSCFWSHVEMGPPDAILGLTEAYKKDNNKKKVNVGVGAYRDDDGKPYVLPVVRKAEERIMENNMNHEYAPIGGHPEFTETAVRLAVGDDCKTIDEKRYATVQSISGTGSLRVGACFLHMFVGGAKTVHLPTPTWGNHIPIFKNAGMEIEHYKYYCPESISFDMEGCCDYLSQLPKKSVVLMHACAHNPTGVDPTKEQWDELSALSKEKHLLIYFDMAYQGFASGDFDEDAYAVRKFIRDGNEIILSQSFAKNMGLYGERAGTLTIIADTSEIAAKILSQLKILIRPLYSNPPIHGARIVSEVLCDKELKAQWFEEVKEMSDRIISARKLLRKHLEDLGSNRSWNHITDQIGMFAYTGLKPKEVERMIKEFSIYMTKDGRISIAGVTTKNAKYLAEAIKAVTE